MVWILIAGTEYFHVPALCWVMFVGILFWVLTIFLFIIYLIGAHKRMLCFPWNTVVIYIHKYLYPLSFETAQALNLNPNLKPRSLILF